MTEITKAVRRSKYGNVRTTLDGYSFASKAEARRYSELKLLERAGEVRNLELQPRFKLFGVSNRPILIRSERYANGRQAFFTPDFAYFDKAGNWIVEDVKGGKATRTEGYVLRKAIFEAMFPTVKITEVTK